MKHLKMVSLSKPSSVSVASADYKSDFLNDVWRDLLDMLWTKKTESV